MRHRIASGTCVFLLLLTVFAGVAAAEGSGQYAATAVTANETGPAIQSVEATRAAETGPNGTVFVWERADGHQIAVSVTPSAPNLTVCASTTDSVTCTPVDSGGTVTLTAPATDGTEPLSLSLRDETNATMDTKTVSLQPIHRAGDVDGDGLNNGNEVTAGTSLVDADTDGDGLSDDAERDQHGTDPLAADTDGDGLPDNREVAVGTNPTVRDTDDDGLGDLREASGETNPTDADTDGDGLTDGRERAIGTSPARADTDGDDLNDGREMALDTDPRVTDTDGDGLNDGWELAEGTDPLARDTDDDGLADGEELAVGTAPATSDTDGDGFSDGREVGAFGTDPLAADSDSDLLSDRTEVAWGTNPTDALTPLWATSALFGFLAGIALTVTAIGRDWATPLSKAGRTLVYRCLELDREILAVNREIDTADSEVGVDDAAIDADTATETFEQADGALLSDDRLVILMLRAENGRMRQTNIVEATDWSKAKVSRLLSDMVDADDIVKIRLGRENLICLERATPAAATRADDVTAPAPSG